MTFGNHSMDTVVPITEVTASFMYTFLVAAIILLTDIFSDIFLLTDLETIEPMDEPANKADISRSNGH
ncbi:MULTISPECIES: hypothetical protein [Geobacillus]|uniref:hypothetical protein n=1 Tax=Geobacillus TaxID=129337 RepID=UPI000422A554|nr:MULTISPECIES: hypothetical protein [Geobacillus]OQP08479.1 hypothetical protein B1691_15225 [Geobacillus sp. 47C-IIb]ARA99486.1 hypothetical protein GD3902_16510 [Geobacillus thermodenitrificans]MEC5189270.1 hypothetical protein [Geobacillus thermodenitrificans]MED3718933.1 hypothetical protein [Geobacillus thermodenitrificans]NNU88221.1 hypothetical protein [Geobacillus sp. MR]